MNKAILNNIDVMQLENEIFDLDELIKGVKEQLIESDLLVGSADMPKYSLSKDTIKGEFEENLWVMTKELNKDFIYFDFSELEKLKFKGVTDNDINLIKCWIVESILEKKYENVNESLYVNQTQQQSQFSWLVKFIDKTHNFNKDFLDGKKGSRLANYFESLATDNLRHSAKTAIFKYIDYMEDKVCDEFLDVLSQYISEINLLNIQTSKYSARELPRSKDILLFSNYLDSFFYNKDTNETLKLYFMPVLLWWKITTVIPMRPSEFCIKIKRDCLIKENDNYYLRINRIKKKADIKNNLLPVLKKVKITKEIYDLVYDYILATDIYGTTKTLISYAAMLALRKELTPIFSKNNSYFYHFNGDMKIDKETFTLNVFTSLLKKFYEVVICSMYKDTYIKKRVVPGDTRHIAFTSLLLQGYSPVEIAIIGGHRTLSAFDNYTCSVNTYVDTEVVNIIRKNIEIESRGYSKVIDVFSKMPKECPVSLEECVTAMIDDEELGYCTIIKKNPKACYVDDCYECNKWWCNPSEYNFLKLENILKNRLRKKNNKLQRDLDFIITLFKEIGIEVIDGKVVMDHSAAQGLRRLSMELESNTKDIIELKYKIVHCGDNGVELLSELEDLLPMEEVNKYIEKSIIETQENLKEKIFKNDEDDINKNK